MWTPMEVSTSDIRAYPRCRSSVVSMNFPKPSLRRSSNASRPIPRGRSGAPVTTIGSSRTRSETSTASTRVVSVLLSMTRTRWGRYPTKRNSTTLLPVGRSLSRNLPEPSVVVCFLVPSRITSTPASGRRVESSIAVPIITAWAEREEAQGSRSSAPTPHVLAPSIEVPPERSEAHQHLAYPAPEPAAHRRGHPVDRGRPANAGTVQVAVVNQPATPAPNHYRATAGAEIGDRAGVIGSAGALERPSGAENRCGRRGGHREPKLGLGRADGGSAQLLDRLVGRDRRVVVAGRLRLGLPDHDSSGRGGRRSGPGGGGRLQRRRHGGLGAGGLGQPDIPFLRRAVGLIVRGRRGTCPQQAGSDESGGDGDGCSHWVLLHSGGATLNLHRIT